jgi:signal transduction histidine kinase
VRSAREPAKSHPVSFRTKLLVAMMLLVSTLTATGLYLAEHNATKEMKRDRRRDFQAELAAMHRVEEVRFAALAERFRVIMKKPRLHAALEDNALDLLYPSARDELRDVMMKDPALTAAEQSRGLHARFYRFLDRTGTVLPPPSGADVGELTPEEETQLTLKPLPSTPQVGYLVRTGAVENERIDEIIALPIQSTETSEVIAALVMGFKPVDMEETLAGDGMKSGIWVNGFLQLPGVSESARAAVHQEMDRALRSQTDAERSYRVQIEGVSHLLFYKQLNPDSVYPAAYEVCIYSLHSSMAQQRRLRWQILGTGAALLVLAFVASHLIAARLAAPVEKLAVDSAQDRAHRKRAEETLASTHEELKRSTRFSADASHQLKTPVTVLRAGLEQLLARENFPDEVYDELSALVHQTYRLTGVIDDLLLLSRMDAGRLQIDFKPINLTQLVDDWLDDLSALPDAVEVAVTRDLPPTLEIASERRYASLIVQNLLENARKYNHPGGRIHVAARTEGDWAVLTVGNTGPLIPAKMQERIFERFARGAASEAVSGHGLGLNLARQLARLHGGDLHLVSSNEKWTEFAVRFQLARAPAIHPAVVS